MPWKSPPTKAADKLELSLVAAQRPCLLRHTEAQRGNWKFVVAEEMQLHAGSCVSVVSSKCISLQQPGHEPQGWTFDLIAGETTSQQEMFCGQIPSFLHNVLMFSLTLHTSCWFRIHEKMQCQSRNAVAFGRSALAELGSFAL